MFGAILYSKNKYPTLDLLKNQDWSHMTGASITPNGILVSPTNMTIVHQDGSIPQPNPPVNLAGPHLKFNGNIQITAVMQGVANSSLRLYGEPPIIYDEWRKESPSINVNINYDMLTARIWDGSSSTPMDIRTASIPAREKITLTLRDYNHNIFILVNGRVITKIPDHNIFVKGEIWFGLDTKVNNWLLKNLTAQALRKSWVHIIPSPQFNLAHDNPMALRNLSQVGTHKILIGTAVPSFPLFYDDDYRNLVASQFNIITPENAMKPEFIHPQQDTYSFEEADNLVRFAQNNQILVHGHTLVYGKANPQWMTQAPAETREKIMVDHIKAVVEHFQGQVAEWDVINEPLSDKDPDYLNSNNGLRSNIWFEAMGEDYIETALRQAHTADPQAKLFINDYGLEKNDKRWDAMLSLLKRLKAQGVPIDGVGFESHVYYDSDLIDPKVLSSHIQTLASLGLRARISEIDVYGDDPQLQANQYSAVLRVCIAEPNCDSYTTWGITDRYGSTTRPDRYPLVTGNSLLWDEGMKPKQALEALQRVFQQ
ncbi:MAG TPA: endo-1,4-beta-xylanase [Methylomirabilota bacterium]|nr:endo-1,4-beta-xylanase [Methylomirabilota bacterium]